MQAADLQQIPFLSAVPVDELEDWAAAARTQNVSRRETLVMPGDDLHSLYLVRQGLVILCLATKAEETRLTAIVDPTQCFNIQCLHPQAKATESAHALTDSELVTIPGKLVRATLEKGGVLARVLGGFAAGRLCEVTDDYARATTLDVRARTAVSLLRLSDRLNTNNIPLTQEQLSGLVGTRRETLALILGALRNEEIIDTRYRMIKILDRDRLVDASRLGYPTCIDHAVPSPLTGDSTLEE